MSESLFRHASPRPWFVVGTPWNEAAPFITSGAEEPHVREFVCGFIDMRGEDGPAEARRSEADAELICMAVNAYEGLLGLARELISYSNLRDKVRLREDRTEYQEAERLLARFDDFDADAHRV